MPDVRLRVQPSVPKVRLRVLPSLRPLEIELQSDGTEIQWRHVGNGEAWQNIVPIDDLSASVEVGSVTTLAPGSPATVANVGTDQAAVLNFGIPKGFDGQVTALQAGTAIAVDATDPTQPKVSVAPDTDGTLTANSDTHVASQKATKTYVDGSLAPNISAATDTAFADADFIPARQNSGGAPIKRSWANLKSAVLTALGPLIGALTNKTTPVDLDGVLLADSAASAASKVVTFTQMWTNYFKGKADALYAAIGAVPAWTIKASDTSRASNVTPAIDPDLQVTLAANKRYHIKVLAIFLSTSATPGYSFSFTVPASLVLVAENRYALNGSGTGGGSGFFDQWNSAGTALSDSASSALAANVAGALVLDLIVTTGASGGAFGLNWAQKVSNATATTVKAGSYINAQVV